ncbi:glycosyl hydrolase family 18 protein [Alkaliphilus peptidifermentans]|uniref:chitinase n=1 Tax=Alkaliphilus peptidifermentans DSM 18978 TaxID=1120976 RepID=A0A1G5IVQ9_9FIRM|nr:glycosyl hydrolase family 18 protein [Alkaliphilus peptidifermentans]SCY79800.1 chitinase family 18 [Alkaliphilus peptidifermentans DSM 18978]
MKRKQIIKICSVFFLVMLFLANQVSVGLTAASLEEDQSQQSANKRIVAYYTAWSTYGRNYNVPDIPADKITHINYAFANISNQGTIMLGDPWADVEKAFPGDSWDQPLKGHFNQLNKLKENHPHLQTLISVGGWTWSDKFSDIALTNASRSNFAASCVDFIRQYGFNGVDIDWEYPVEGGMPNNIYRPEDKQNFTHLLRELREQLDAAGQEDGTYYLLTVATSAGADKILNLELDQIHQYLDFINVMTYDFHGGWENITNHHAPLYANPNDPSSNNPPGYIKTKYNTHSAIQQYLDGGVPEDKVVVGVPFYGRGWSGVTNNNNGLFQSAAGVPPGTWDDWASGNTGVFDYTDIKRNYLPTYGNHFDEASKVPYVYSPATGIMISYEDPISVGLKSDYVMENNLGGIMFWEISCDRDSDLLNVIYDKLNDGGTQPLNPKSSTVSTDKVENDGNYTVTVTIPPKSRADYIKLTENNVVILEENVDANYNNNTTIVVPFSDKPEGIYIYQAQLLNDYGSTVSNVLNVTVSEGGVEPIYPAWNSTSIYHVGDKVTWQNSVWEAKWWTQGEEPGTTGEWGVWKLISE